MKITIIYRYIIKELVWTFFVSLAFLNSILSISNLFNFSKKFLALGISMMDFLMFIIMMQPQVMLFTIPIALLLGILITYGRLNMDNEFVILKASGMSFVSIAKPVFTMGAACFAISLFISLYLGPAMMSKIKEDTAKIISKRLSTAIKEGMFNMAFKDVMIMPNSKVSPDTFAGIFIYDSRKKEPNAIWAKEAKFTPLNNYSSINISLKEGMLYSIHENSVTEISFALYSLNLNVEQTESSKGLQEISTLELLKSAHKTKELAPVMETHKRFSLPLLCLIIMLLGPPLFPIAGRTGRLGGLSMGLFICTLYYLATIYLNNLAGAGKIHHFIGGWGATVSLAVCAIIAFYRISRK